MREPILKWSIPIIFFLMACWQFYMVDAHGLTRWKGGGYGMYTEIHPKERQVWVQWGDSIKRVAMATGHSIQWHRKAVLLCYRPSDEKMKKFARDYANAHQLQSVTVQIWKPQVDTKNNTLFRSLINEESYVSE